MSKSRAAVQQAYRLRRARGAVSRRVDIPGEIDALLRAHGVDTENPAALGELVDHWLFRFLDDPEQLDDILLDVTE